MRQLRIMLKIIFISIFLQGCTTYVGIAIHPAFDRPEYNGGNPLLNVRSQIESDRYFSFCEHVSSIPDREKGYGLNMCGAGFKF